MKTEDLNLENLKALCLLDPKLRRFLDRKLVSDYDGFVKILYQDLDDLIADLQENPEKRQYDGEDRLTLEMKTILCQLGWNASHDTKIGGHSDLVVRKDNFLWIGEAKIHKGCKYLWQGFQQLATRYSLGSHNQNSGGLIIYIRKKSAKSIMDKWRDTLRRKELEGFIDYDCHNNPLAFFSSHKHVRSGMDFKIRHIPVLLYFQPEDRK